MADAPTSTQISTGAPAAEQEAEVSDLERKLVLWLTNFSHALNHFQNNMVSVMYPLIMTELGFGYAQLGVLTAIREVLGSGAQVCYGFLTPFLRRTRLLGLGNVVLGFGTLITALVGSFNGFVVARTVAAVGSSAQHPVGASLLSGYFPRNRGTILALNTSIASVGSLIAPLAAGLLLLVLAWRDVFFIVAFASLAMAVPYFLMRERMSASAHPGTSRRARLAQGKASYLRAMRTRNMIVISLVMTVGAAGRGAGVNQAYLAPHFVNEMGIPIAVVGVALSVLHVGAILGPIGFGWLSDRLSRKGVIQTSLLLSSLATFWLAHQGAYLPALFANLLVYGAVTHSRATLTQALVADSVSDEDRDAAFSLYYFIGFISGPFWALLTGFLMETYGFELAFSVLAISYLAGMGIMFLVQEPKRA